METRLTAWGHHADSWSGLQRSQVSEVCQFGRGSVEKQKTFIYSYSPPLSHFQQYKYHQQHNHHYQFDHHHLHYHRHTRQSYHQHHNHNTQPTQIHHQQHTHHYQFDSHHLHYRQRHQQHSQHKQYPASSTQKHTRPRRGLYGWSSSPVSTPFPRFSWVCAQSCSWGRRWSPARSWSCAGFGTIPPRCPISRSLAHASTASGAAGFPTPRADSSAGRKITGDYST